MSQTQSYSISNSKDVLNSLNKFDSCEPELAKIKELSNVSNHTLKPEDFYEGIQELDLDGFQSFKVDFIDTIDEIKKYIKHMAVINSGGVLSTSSIPFLNKNSENGLYGNNAENNYKYKPTHLNNSNVTVNDISNQSNNAFNNLQNSSILENGVIDQITDTSGNIVAVSVVSDGKKNCYKFQMEM